MKRLKNKPKKMKKKNTVAKAKYKKDIAKIVKDHSKG